jgi:hypothetical protein
VSSFSGTWFKDANWDHKTRPEPIDVALAVMAEPDHQRENPDLSAWDTGKLHLGGWNDTAIAPAPITSRNAVVAKMGARPGLRAAV